MYDFGLYIQAGVFLLVLGEMFERLVCSNMQYIQMLLSIQM